MTHTHTHSRWGSSGRGIGPSQRPLPAQHETFARQTTMPVAEFEIPASEWRQTYSLERSATEIGKLHISAWNVLGFYCLITLIGQILPWGMNDTLSETGRRNGKEMNEKKTKVMRISGQPSPVQIMTDQNQPENVKYFNYLGSMIINDPRCTCEIKSRISIAKATFNKKNDLFTSKLDLNCCKKLAKC